jgi:hypothetical protein
MSQTDRSRFVDAVLDAYRKTPGTVGIVRKADRRLATQLFDDGVPLELVTAALALAACRRVCRPKDADPLEPVRSLHYFKPVINELLRGDPDSFFLSYIEDRLRRLGPSL